MSGKQLDPIDGPAGVVATACLHRRTNATREAPAVAPCRQPDAREGQAGLPGVSERFMVPEKPCNDGGGKGPQFQNNVSRAESREIGVSLEPPAKVGKLREALHAKAKGSPGYRFYLLYDKMYRAEVLAWAYDRCRENRGVSGVDDQTFAGIEKYGVQRWLNELAEELRKRTYRPQAVRRVWIPKADGSKRPLGIPTVKDRVVQTAALIVLEPIFEADLQPEQYAYRPDRGAWDALQHVFRLLNTGYREVVDADLSGYFDNIPHGELMKSVARRISDRHMLHLIKMWLEAPVEETNPRGQKQRTYYNRDQGRGTPQGAPLSPLLANLYMRRFVLGWKVAGHEQRLAARIVNYADDFVICCRGTAEQAMHAMRDMMARLKLTVNERKTRICCVPGETFQFLGYTVGECYSFRRQRSYLGMRPAKKAVERICRAISEMTHRRLAFLPTEEIVRGINQRLAGWANYFQLGSVSPAYRVVDQHTRYRLYKWLRWKHKVGRGATRLPARYLYQTLGLICLPRLSRCFPRAMT
jgi:RNA-directed DNA polymerase